MVSELWYEILGTAEIPRDGTIVEVAPGFKSKVGRALSDHNFAGDYHLIEPNPKALEHSLTEYQRILPRAKVYGHQKCLHEIEVERDIPLQADALLANHALDDMVLAMGTPRQVVEEFFSMNSGSERIRRTKELWDAISQTDLERYASKTIEKIVSFLTKSSPQLTILSHYEGKTLTRHNINTPNEIGSYVARELQRILPAYPDEPQRSMLQRAGYGLDWVISDKRRKRSVNVQVKESPKAIERLNPRIFVEEQARKLENHEYEVVYTNNSLLRGLGLITSGNQDETDRIIGECFAYKLSKEKNPDHKVVFSDRQADPTNIALSGNEGSGRACYIGSNFNIKGIGRTQLVKNPEDSLHGTGSLDIVTALREAITSNFLYEKTTAGTSPVLAVLALQDKTKYGWSDQPLQNALLVRLDDGSLDRVSHLAYAPTTRNVSLTELIEKYARFDAEMFAHRILHGAWSTGNSSINGQWLDIESVSLTQGRGARCNITKKYISNYFGYESIGIKQVIGQLVDILGSPLTRKEWEPHFDGVRNTQLTYETLRLLGITPRDIADVQRRFLETQYLRAEFEALAKKISPRKVNLNVFGNDFAGTHLLDFSALFRNFPRLYRQNARLHPYLVREDELRYCHSERYHAENPAEEYLAANVVIEKEQLSEFTRRTEKFLSSLVALTHRLEVVGYLPKQTAWEENAEIANRDYPNFEQLTSMIRNTTTMYQNRQISAQELNERLKEML